MTVCWRRPSPVRIIHFLRRHHHYPCQSSAASATTAPSLRPLNILAVLKPQSPKASAAFLRLAQFLRDNYPATTLYVEEPNSEDPLRMENFNLKIFKKRRRRLLRQKEESNDIVRGLGSSPVLDASPDIHIDFGVTLGGDGTLLHYASLFPRKVPPVISFSLGSLGFLLPFGTKKRFHNQCDEIDLSLCEQYSSSSFLSRFHGFQVGFAPFD